MKLLYLSSPSFADCDFPLIRTFQKKGIDVTYIIVLAPYSLRSTLFDIKEMIPTNGILPASDYEEMAVYRDYIEMSKVYILNNTSPKQSSLSTFKLVRELQKFINKEKFDIIHSDLTFEMQYLWLYTKRNWIKTIHDPFPHSSARSFRNRFMHYLNTKMPAKCVLLNETQKDQFCKSFKRKEEDILINRLGIYDNIRVFSKGDASCRNKNVLFFGRISMYKGIEYLCEAMKMVHEQIPDASLTIAGGGKIYFDITEYEGQPWFSIHNRYVGMQELAGYIDNCAIVVCPYTDATQSGVVMTSYGLNKPVIVTRTGGMPEQVEEGKTGLIVEPCNSRELADAIINLLNNRALLEGMKSYILETFEIGNKSWNAIADDYIQFYEKSM